MIEATWHPTNAPCDGCGTSTVYRERLVVMLMNAKYERYGLPDLIICRECRPHFTNGITSGFAQGEAPIEERRAADRDIPEAVLGADFEPDSTGHPR